MADSIYDFELKDIKGKTRTLADFKGKVLLLVNVASKCGLTPQYAGLQALYERFEAKGFSILAFPANNFGAQEPGTEAQIADFCETNYHVTFPMFSKVSVKGADIHPLYKYLTTEAPKHSEISWNFQKFLVDRQGQVIANIDPRKTPAEIEELIASSL